MIDDCGKFWYDQRMSDSWSIVNVFRNIDGHGYCCDRQKAISQI